MVMVIIGLIILGSTGVALYLIWRSYQPKLIAKFTVEDYRELYWKHGLDYEEEIIRIMAGEIKNEIERNKEDGSI